MSGTPVTQRRPVGVLGASGAVGAGAVEALLRLGIGPLRLGGRSLERLRPVAEQAGRGPGGAVGAAAAGGGGAGPGAGAPAETVAVDVTDPVALRDFVRGCAVVLDCTGPSYELGEAVPVAALAEGVPCVLVTGEQPVYEALTARGLARVPVVLSAGTLPGLSGLLPRLLVASGQAGLGPADGPVGAGARLAMWTGGLERATTTVAADLVLSLGLGADGGAAANLFGAAGAAWRDGAHRSRALTPAEDVEVPGFDDRVGVQPFLSLEAERVAADLGLRDLDSYHVHPGTAVRATLATVPAAHQAGTSMAELIGRILRAAQVDLIGRTPYYRMIFTLTDPSGGQRSLLLRSPDSYRLTAAVGACTVQQILESAVPAGVHFADRVLDPDRMLKHLAVADPATRTDLVEGAADDEEGSL